MVEGLRVIGAESAACGREGLACSCHPADSVSCAGSVAVATRTVALSSLKRGQTGRICECQLAPEDASLLRAMGLCDSARVRLCRAGEPCIVSVDCCGGRGVGAKGWAGVGGARIGLARPLAERILVAVEE